MNGYTEDMMEVRQRVAAHLARGVEDRDFVVPVLEMPKPEALMPDPGHSEEAHAETQPSGAAAVGLGFAALSGLGVTLLILFGPRLLQLLWAITR